MALTTTTLALACGVTDTTIRVVSATGILAGQVMRIDDEWMTVVGAPRATTPPAITVRRGLEGSALAAHTINTPVSAGTSADFSALPPGEVVPAPASTVASTTVLRQVSVTLTHAQILTLPTTPVQIIPAPGPGRVTLASAVFGNGENCVWNFVTPAGVAYGNFDAAARLRVRLGTSGPWTNYQNPSSLFDSTHSQLFIPAFLGAISGGALVDWHDEFENIAVNLSIVNGVLGNLTLGHASNTLTVTMGYRLYDLTTKAFL